MRGTLRRRPGKKHEDMWELAVDLEPDPTTGRRRRVYKVFRGSRKEAERALSKLVQAADSEPAVDPSRETVGAYLERWLRDYVQANVAPKTRMYYTQVVRQHIVPRLGKKKLQQLRSVDIVEAERFWLEEGWLRTATQRGLSAKSVANMHRILHLALRHAVDWKLLAVNPIEGVKPPRWERKEQAWLDLEQAQALVHHLESTPAGTAVLLKLSTGLRMGELLGLRWREIDLNARSIALQQQLQWLDGHGYVMRTVKSHRSRRPVSIDADLVDVLRTHKARQNEVRLQAGDLWQPSDLVFANELGKFLTPDQVRRALFRALRDAGLPRIRPHDLRHTHASVLLRLRTPMKVVQERLGHSSYAITADIYSHVAPDLQEQAAGVFGAALRTHQSDSGASANDVRTAGSPPNV
jgi:integrase